MGTGNRFLASGIKFRRRAIEDLRGIHRVTAAMWGIAQAERYVDFLDSVFEHLLSGREHGRAVEGRPGVYVYLAKINHQRAAHGHRIFFRKISGGIRIIRVLHTAMHWPLHIR